MGTNQKCRGNPFLHPSFEKYPAEARTAMLEFKRLCNEPDILLSAVNQPFHLNESWQIGCC